MPGLDAALARYPLEELERAPSPAIREFRAAGGPKLLVPLQNAGSGATPLQAVRVQRAVGARCPSLAVATTMHHFSIAGLVQDRDVRQRPGGAAAGGDRRGRVLLASGFAEGNTGQNILRPHITAHRRGDRIVLNGEDALQPLALDGPADRVVVPTDEEGVDRLAVALIPAARRASRCARSGGRRSWPARRATRWSSPRSSSIRRCWCSPTSPPTRARCAERGRVPLVRAAAAGGLPGRGHASRSGYSPGRGGGRDDPTPFTVDVEAAMARRGGRSPAPWRGRSGATRCSSRALMARYAAQDAIARTTRTCLAALGGMAFIGSPEGSYLASAAAGLTFHPPSRNRWPSAAGLPGRPSAADRLRVEG